MPRALNTGLATESPSTLRVVGQLGGWRLERLLAEPHTALLRTSSCMEINSFSPSYRSMLAPIHRSQSS